MTACPNGFQTLSSDRTLLPLASINASSEVNDDPARDVVHTGGGEWCSVESLESGPHILLDFTQPIVLTHMRSRGANLVLSYVTEFSVQSQNGGTLEQYQQPNGATVSLAIYHGYIIMHTCLHTLDFTILFSRCFLHQIITQNCSHSGDHFLSTPPSGLTYLMQSTAVSILSVIINISALMSSSSVAY